MLAVIYDLCLHRHCMRVLAWLQSPTVKSTHTAVMVRHGGTDFAPFANFAPAVPHALESLEVCLHATLHACVLPGIIIWGLVCCRILCEMVLGL